MSAPARRLPAKRIAEGGSAGRPAPRRGRDGTATRARIEAEALRLFAQKGIDGTSVRDIAQGAGVSEGALYRHFVSKEELARALFLSRYAALAGKICAIDAREATLAEKLAAVVELACALFDAEPALFAYLLIHQHDHLAHVPEAPEANVVTAVERMLARAGVPAARATLAGAMALGCVVQPAVFALYGRLDGPLGARAGEIARAVEGIVEKI
ncbi:TetR/AcrR family transcriptional regulator [Ancylobacter sp. MQZ15Z-1]|uniref:TetR/AcrR family transcriptional regulator n=1 Tax=Ancylobacter mangrovi TaxID=2972472 RepID=A0A9X2PEJ1_9HYPH|nr:TetR/AcrR family transcriptional regulator [Ancylobacter mangrovi]MCS0495421.1 TetR/AcrR family transcriptional regulator [Ancylobacter mangrovi]